MRHQITQIGKTENRETFKISIQIPFKMGWIERVKFYILTVNPKNHPYEMQHVKNERNYAFFETTVILQTYTIYHYYFSFVVNGKLLYYTNQNITANSNVSKEECWKKSVGFDLPEWINGVTMYHFFVDKHHGENNNINYPILKKSIPSTWYESPVIGPTKNESWNVDFHCEDLIDIAKALNYTKMLGINIIYLSPIIRSQSNPIDLYAGTHKMLKELCKKTHQKGMRVVLDSVFNYEKDDSIYYSQCGIFDIFGAYQSEINKCFELGIDGLRLDYELPQDFIREIYKVVEHIKPDGFILGDVCKRHSLCSIV